MHVRALPADQARKQSSLRCLGVGFLHALDSLGGMSVYDARGVLPETDEEATRRDWEAVGGDLLRAMLIYEHQRNVQVLCKWRPK